MKSLKIFLVKMALLADKNPTLWDRLRYIWDAVKVCGPVAFLLDGLGAWFADNHRFVWFVVGAVLINIGYGIYFHIRTASFHWGQLINRASLMIGTILVSYTLLEMLRLTAGENIVGEAFKVVIQVMTLLYPASKTIKQVHILTNGEFPPEFIMKRLYNFEKSGKLEEMFNGKNETL